MLARMPPTELSLIHIYVDSRIGESVADTIRALDVVLRVRLLNH